jgi:hypothetical protein
MNADYLDENREKNFVSSRMSAKAKAMAPRRPPYDMMIMSMRVSSSRRQQLARLAKIVMPRKKHNEHVLR